MANGMYGRGIKTFLWRDLSLTQVIPLPIKQSLPLLHNDQPVRFPRLLKQWLRRVFDRFAVDGESLLATIKDYLRDHDNNFLSCEEKQMYLDNGLLAIKEDFIWVTFDQLVEILLKQVHKGEKVETNLTQIPRIIDTKSIQPCFSRLIPLPSTYDYLPSIETPRPYITMTHTQEQIANAKQLESKLPKVDESVVDRINLLMSIERIDLNKGNDSDEEDMDISNPDTRLSSRKNPLSRDDEDLVTDALSPPYTEEVLIEKFKIPMSRAKISCLKPCKWMNCDRREFSYSVFSAAWLNDEVINFYMEMLSERDLTLCALPNTHRSPSHFFSSFFISKLLENGSPCHDKVKRWTKKFDIFSKHKVFFPINISNTHWTLAVAFLKEKKIVYYDSMGGTGERYTRALVDYFVRESEVKRGITMTTTEWKTEAACKVMALPQQRNGVDCGMFTIMYADFLSDDLDLRGFGQEDIPTYRRKTVAAILRGCLDYQ